MSAAKPPGYAWRFDPTNRVPCRFRDVCDEECPFAFRQTWRGEKQNGDIYLILEKDVRRFILEHPTEIDLRKVDQLWFLDLVTNGLVRSV